MSKHSRYNVARIILIFWTLFIGLGAVGGALAMLIDPTGEATGMAGLLPGLRKLPLADVLFQDLVFSGISLLIVNGITNLIAAVLLILKKRAGAILGCIFGVTLMLWITIQFFIFESNFMSNSYFVFGLLQALTGYAAIVFQKQESFKVNEESYTAVGTNDKVLVVYFSRMGYVKKLAYGQAEKTGGKIFELKTTEKTDGTLGFWWCGRFNMHKWNMPLESIPEDLNKYDKVIICTPVWVFALAAPVRAFCRGAKGIKRVEYVICHYSNMKCDKIVKEMNELLGTTPDSVTDVTCKKGKYVKQKNIKK